MDADNNSALMVDILSDFLRWKANQPVRQAPRPFQGTVRAELEMALAKPDFRADILQAVQRAEIKFRQEAMNRGGDEVLIQVIVGLPTLNRILCERIVLEVFGTSRHSSVSFDLMKLLVHKQENAMFPGLVEPWLDLYERGLAQELTATESFMHLYTALDFPPEPPIRILGDRMTGAVRPKALLDDDPGQATDDLSTTGARPVGDATTGAPRPRLPGTPTTDAPGPAEIE